MTPAPVPRFDDPRPSSARLAGARIAEHPVGFVAAVILGALVGTVVTVMLVVASMASDRFADAVDGVRLTAYVDPRWSRSDAAGLQTLLAAIPSVRTTTFRSRDDAVAGLAEPAFSIREQNPVPDAWIVALRRRTPAADAASLASYVAAARDALTTVRGIQAVRFEERWVDTLDRWGARLRPFIDGLRTGAYAILIIGLSATGALAGRALTSSSAATKASSVLVGLAIGVATLVVCGAIGIASDNALRSSTFVREVTVDYREDVSIVVIGLVALIVGLMTADRARRSNN